MENIISARRLRKSALNGKNSNINFNDVGIANLDIKKKTKEHEIDEDFDFQSIKDNKRNKNKFKQKVFLKIIFATNIILLCLICKMMFKEKVLNNAYSKIIINEYLKDYSKEDALNKFEGFFKKIKENVKYIIPQEILDYITKNYTQRIKGNILNFSLKEKVFNIFGKSDIDNNTGVGGGEPIEEGQLQQVISAMSLMDSDSNEILSKKISIITPVKGTITSRYGTREQIFNNVNPYHTGIDIANKLNSTIQSATDGIVVKVEDMNKYYGNNIEIEKDGVIFKYAHLNKINVKLGDNIKQGDNIGLMGSTGMSTGSHLHFEIKINSRTVDPEKILSFN